MLPTSYHPLPTLPLTPNGKIDRTQLPEPSTARPAVGGSFVAPEGELENRLAALWEQMLGISDVGVTDSFFDLGGTSLSAVRLVARLRDDFGCDVALSTLFGGAAIADIAERIRGDGGDGVAAAAACEQETSPCS